MWSRKVFLSLEPLLMKDRAFSVEVQAYLPRPLRPYGTATQMARAAHHFRLRPLPHLQGLTQFDQTWRWAYRWKTDDAFHERVLWIRYWDVVGRVFFDFFLAEPLTSKHGPQNLINPMEPNEFTQLTNSLLSRHCYVTKDQIFGLTRFLTE